MTACSSGAWMRSVGSPTPRNTSPQPDQDGDEEQSEHPRQYFLAEGDVFADERRRSHPGLQPFAGVRRDRDGEERAEGHDRGQDAETLARCRPHGGGDQDPRGDRDGRQHEMDEQDVGGQSLNLGRAHDTPAFG